MRNLKKLLALIVAVTTILTFTVPAFAADATTATKTDAQVVTDLGVVLGTGGGVTADYLASQPDRVQGAIMFLRLKGLEQTALAFTGTDNFSDVSKLSAGNKAILAYLKANPDLGFIGIGGGKYDPLSKMTAKQYYKLMLMALGYTYSDTDATADFNYKTILSFAAGKGLTKLIDNEKFTVNDLAIGTVEALKANVKGGTKTLVAQMAEANADFSAKAVTSGIYTKPVVKLAVTGATATNLKEINVTFNKDLDADSAKLATNYTLSTGVISKSELVGTTGVLLTVSGAGIANQTSVDLTVKNVKDSAGAVIADTTKSVSFLDVTPPQFTGVTVTGPKTIDVTFSEPLQTVPTFKIDNGTYYVSNNFAAGAKTITLTLGIELPAGAHTVVAKDGTDYFGLKIAETSISYNYAADTTAPTVTVDSASENKVVLKFSKKVEIKKAADVSAYYAYNNDSNNYKGTFTKDADSTDSAGYCDKWNVTFTTPIPAGSQTFYLNTKANAFEDKYGNDVASVVLPISVVTDTVKPTVASVAMDSDSDKKIKVTFSEDVQPYDATNKTYYTLKDATGAVVKNATYADVDDNGHFNVKGNITYANKVATITATDSIPGGNYYLVVEKVRDTAYIKNTMDAATIAFAVADKTAPTLSSAIVSSDHKKIRVAFNEAMSTTGLTTTSNYRMLVDTTNPALNAPLPDNTTITVVDAKTVEIALGGLANANIDGTNDALWVGGTLADAAGNTIGGFYQPVSISTDGIAYVADSAKAINKNTITFQVNKELSKVDADQISVSPSALGIASAYAVNDSGKSTVTVVLRNDMLPDVSDFASLTVSGAALTNVFGTTNTSFAINTTGTTKLLDKVAPSITTVAALTVSTVAITFDEDIDPTTVSKYTFTVPGANVSSIDWTTTNSVLQLTLDTALASDAAPQLTQALDLTDAAGNKLASGSTVVATVDQVVPTAKAYVDDNFSFKLASDTTITVVFSEALDAAKFTTYPYGFSVGTAGTLTGVTLSGDGRYVTLTGTGFTTSTTVTYTPGTLTDKNGNLLAGFATVAVH